MCCKIQHVIVAHNTHHFEPSVKPRPTKGVGVLPPLLMDRSLSHKNANEWGLGLLGNPSFFLCAHLWAALYTGSVSRQSRWVGVITIESYTFEQKECVDCCFSSLMILTTVIIVLNKKHI